MHLFSKTKKLILSFFLITGISSCEEKMKEQPDLKSDRLFIVSFISPQDTMLMVRVYNTLASNTEYPVPTYNYYDTSTYVDHNKVNSDATVLLSDGVGSIALSYDKLHGVYTAKAALLPITEGKKYFLEVSAPGKKSISANCTIPKTVLISSAQLDSIENPYFSYFTKGSFVDNPEEGNAYYAETAMYRLYRDYWTSIVDSAATYSTGYYFDINLVTDENRNGATMDLKTTKVSFDFYYDYYSIFFTVYSIDQNYLKYYRWLKEVENLGPFTQPSLIYTNINNGLGVFAGYNKSMLIVKRLPPQ